MFLQRNQFEWSFDAGCETTTGLSLNDVQIVGPKIQGDLVYTLYRFRCFKFAFIADVVQMFRQVKIHRSHWEYQRIFWRKYPTEPLEEYWLTCVTQGTASASFMAVRAMVQCARDNVEKYPLAAKAIEENFYMDDGLFGADDEKIAIDLVGQLILCLKSGGFLLDKWGYNHKYTFDRIFTRDSQKNMDVLSEGMVLGLKWTPDSDHLFIKFTPTPTMEIITKRQIVREIARIYDPLGYIAPIIVLFKQIIQNIWREQTKWDRAVSEDILKNWKNLHSQLQMLSIIKVPRWLGCSSISTNQIHGFCDASNYAYGSVLYLRSIKVDGSIEVNIIGSKNRIVSIKAKTTIPRLELSAAVLLAKLSEEFKMNGRIPLQRTYLWCDSSIVLHWIRKPIHKLDTYVANRVQSIHCHSKIEQWNYVPTNENPADILSRGCSTEKLAKCQLWFTGPNWLKQHSSVWYQTPPSLNEQTIEQIHAEYKKSARLENSEAKGAVSVLQAQGNSLLVTRSTLRSLLRVTGYVLRFINNIRKKSCCDVRYITVAESFIAFESWIKWEQQRIFLNEYKALINKESISKSSSILNLTPWLDSKGIIRVGGRIKNAHISFAQKHPVVLPYDSNLSKLLIQDTHRITAHGGTQLMMTVIR